MNFKIVVPILFILISCNEPQRNCKNFKTGTFTFSQKINGKTEFSKFERQENIQIEEFNGKKDTTSIRWINDCEYILQKIKPKNMLEKKAIHFKILTTTDSSYTFEYSFVGNAEKQRGEVVKKKILFNLN